MFDLIILILVIIGINKKIKQIREQTGKEAREAMDMPKRKKMQASAKPNQPRKEHQQWEFLKKKKETDAYGAHTSGAGKRQSAVRTIQNQGHDIMNKVNQHIYGTDADKADLMLYKKYLETERRTDIKKMAREMKCTMYQVISEIRDFQEMGYFSNVIIDDDDYVIHYKDAPQKDSFSADGIHREKAAGASAKKRPADKKPSKEDPIQKHEVHGSASVRLNACETCGTDARAKKKTNPYMTMPEHGMEIGYMTMTQDYTISYMTMPEGGMEIGYNTIPDLPEEEV